MGDAVIGEIPVRDPVVAGAQDPVDRPGDRLEIGARAGPMGSLARMRVDRRLLDAGVVVAAVRVGGRRREELVQTVERRRRTSTRRDHDDVEVEVVLARLVLRRVDLADGRADADRLRFST